MNPRTPITEDMTLRQVSDSLGMEIENLEMAVKRAASDPIEGFKSERIKKATKPYRWEKGNYYVETKDEDLILVTEESIREVLEGKYRLSNAPSRLHPTLDQALEHIREKNRHG